MNCKRVRESLLDLATGTGIAPEVEEHVRECALCRERAEEMRATMAMLGEWSDIEPSPYFDTRLRARTREQQPPPGIWVWLRKPAVAAVFVLLMVTGVALFQRSESVPQGNVAQVQSQTHATPRSVGTPVSDLQALDRNEDLYANFDLLDDVSMTEGGAMRAQ